MIFTTFLALAALAAADNRVFADRGTTDCKACLAQVEAACNGPITSDQFNDCFCSVGEKGLAWPKLADCLTGQNAKCPQDVQYDTLGDWGAHCFAYKKNEQEEVCVPSTQNNKLLMSVADVFCTEFVTLTTASASTPSSTASSVIATTTQTEKHTGTKTPTTASETGRASVATMSASSHVTTAATASTALASNSGSGASTTTTTSKAAVVIMPPSASLYFVGIMTLSISGLIAELW